jgi:macrolide transport system ATP-binding/permease protein
MLPPSWIYTIPLRLRSLFRRKTVEPELDDELQFHLDRRTEMQIAQGLPSEESRREALRAIGGLTQRKEECRDMRKTRPLEIVWRDVRYSFRALKSSPLFTLVAILSLALGIGANTAIFTLMYSILWKPLPVRAPGQLVQLMRTSSTESDGGYPWYLFQQLSETAPPFTELIAQTAASREKFGMTVDCSERAIGEAVSANYFRALKVTSLRGRVFQPEDDNISGGSHVAVLSHAFWAGRFRSDSSILGKTIYYDETPYVVVGVAEPGFAGVQPGTAVDVWVPVTAAVPVSELEAKSGGYLKVFARLNANSQIGAALGAWNGRFRAYVSRDLLPRYARSSAPSCGSRSV